MFGFSTLRLSTHAAAASGPTPLRLETEPSSALANPHRIVAVFLLLSTLLPACGDNSNHKYLYVLPDGKVVESLTDIGNGSDAQQKLDSLLWPDSPDPDAIRSEILTPEDLRKDDEGETPLPDVQPADDVDLPDDAALADALKDIAPFDSLPIPDTQWVPEATTDCDPLGLPDVWEGTFDGEVVSNIPDFAGYTFNGPVYGEVKFELKCFNQKYVVFGTLDGGATNCALRSGCPFTAKLGGFFNPTTGELDGTILDGKINYTAVIVHAEGTFIGKLETGPMLAGNWQGSKTSLENFLIPGLSLDWVTAEGTGTWQVYPATE